MVASTADRANWSADASEKLSCGRGGHSRGTPEEACEWNVILAT